MNRLLMPLCTLMLVAQLLPFNILWADQPNRPTQRHGDRWIGITTVSASSPLRAQLLLPKDQGIVVRSVARDSPAERAGLRRNDLLLTAEDRKLRRPKDLSRVVSQSSRPKLAIQFLRAGRRHQTFVQPVARRQVAKPMSQGTAKSERPFLQALLNQLAPAIDAENANAGNDNIMDDLLPNLPKNFQITLRRDAGGPPRFLVEREGQRWETDGRSLNRLGQALLPLAEGLLRSAPTVPSEPSELKAGDSPIAIPQVEIPLPSVELPSDLTPLNESPR